LSFINHLQDDIPIVITNKAQFVTPRFYSGDYAATENFHKTLLILGTFSHFPISYVWEAEDAVNGDNPQ
jgi:hypothetical protein